MYTGLQMYNDDDLKEGPLLRFKLNILLRIFFKDIIFIVLRNFLNIFQYNENVFKDLFNIIIYYYYYYYYYY